MEKLRAFGGNGSTVDIWQSMFAVVHIYNKPLDLIFKISTTRVFLEANKIGGKLGITFCAFETKKKRVNVPK